jgi:hypothetical protein
MLAALLLLAAPPTPQLTDAQILAFAASPFDKAEKTGLIELLGYHHGQRVLVDYPCSDLCPHYTTRIIHYDAFPVTELCDAAGGVIRQLTIPIGIGVGQRPYCVPAVLADPKVYDPSPY